MAEVSSSQASLDQLTDDTLLAIFKRLDIEDRLKCAHVCRRWYILQSKWLDVQAVAISQKHFIIKNDYIQSSIAFQELEGTKINPAIMSLLVRCYHTNILVIHNSRVLKYFSHIWSLFKNLKILLLPNEVFDELSFKDNQTLAHLLGNPKLECLHILTSKKAIPSKTRVFAPSHVAAMKSECFEVFHAQGVILGPMALEHLADKQHKRLRELRIGGVCVHTPAAERYWNAIRRFERLRILELPPSLFSISRPLKVEHLKALSVMKKLDSISVYVCHGSGGEFGTFVQFLLKSVKHIYVLDSSGNFPADTAEILAHQNIKLQFLPSHAINLMWPFNYYDEHGQLILTAFWLPPYFPQVELNGMAITPEVIRAQRSNWDCTLPDLAKFEEKSLTQVALETAVERDHGVTSPGVTTGQSVNDYIVQSPAREDTVQEMMEGLIHRLQQIIEVEESTTSSTVDTVTTNTFTTSSDMVTPTIENGMLPPPTYSERTASTSNSQVTTPTLPRSPPAAISTLNAPTQPPGDSDVHTARGFQNAPLTLQSSSEFQLDRTQDDVTAPNTSVASTQSSSGVSEIATSSTQATRSSSNASTISCSSDSSVDTAWFL